MRTPKTAEENDPCWKERQLTYKCLDDNNYNKEKCEGFIENGKHCKQFWLAVAVDRRTKRIYPEVPFGEEREKVRKEFLSRYRKPVIHVKVQN